MELEQVREKSKKIRDAVDREKEQLEEENRLLTDKIESILFVCKEEEYLIGSLDKKSKILEENFQNIQSYLNICDKSYAKIKDSNRF